MIVIAGPCVIEDEGLMLETAKELKNQLSGLPIQLFFKSSFDKANRSSIEGFRGPGLEKGLQILEKIKAQTGLPIFTDFHTPDQAEKVASVCDFIQVPAFLCRQTDMIVSAALACIRYSRKLNIKKGQFLSPNECKNIVEKVRSVEANHPHKDREWFYLCERGTTHGYGDLIVDMRSIPILKKFGVPVIYDATHSIQSPGGGPGGKSTGGKREFLEVLARAAFMAGADGLFMECHPNPSVAKSDGPNALPLEYAGAFVQQILEIHSLAKKLPYLLPETRSQE